MYRINEVEEIVTADGEIYRLEDGAMRALLSVGGRGMPGIEYETFRGYQQPYEVVTGWTLEPRTIQLRLFMESLTRSEYWEARRRLLDVLRFNRGGPLLLRHTREDGTRREIECFPQSSPVIPSDTESWDSYIFDISLIAFNPLFRDVSDTVFSATFPIVNDLIFPIDFPIAFYPESYSATLNITYTGTFVSYPTIEITGPYSTISFTNLDTGAFLGLSVPITASEKRIIDLTPREQSIVDAGGVDRFGELSLPNSNLVAFNLRPSGTNWRNSPFSGVPDGVNRIWMQATGITSSTRIDFIYRQQYIDIA